MPHSHFTPVAQCQQWTQFVPTNPHPCVHPEVPTGTPTQPSSPFPLPGHVPPAGKWPCKWTSRGPIAAVGEGSPTACMGCLPGRTWPMAMAVALLRVDPTQSCETGRVRRLRWHKRRRERKGVLGGKAGRARALEGERPMGAATDGGVVRRTGQE